MTLTEEQTHTLEALLEAIELATGIWPQIEAGMREYGVEDPETAYEELREAVLNR